MQLYIKLKEIINDQQSLHEVIMTIQELCLELNLDFDSALDKAELERDLPEGCDHAHAYPTGGGSIFCPECNVQLLKGNDEIADYVQQNLWRPNG